MTAARPHTLNDQWKQRLDLSSRGIPDFYETADSVRYSPHAGAIRIALDELGASAIFCVQGVPTIAILSMDAYERTSVIDLHAALWNQGLASLLLVISGDTLRSFSLSRKPYAGLHEEFDQRCLIETLDATTDAIALRNLVYGAESGRLWMEKTTYFRQEERIDQVLLDNLTESHRLLCGKKLSSDAAQALLIQAMFIAYLEDRDVLTEDYFLNVSQDGAESFAALLERGNVGLLDSLFKKLRKDFNGDLFVAPCSFEEKDRPPSLNRSHLDILARFRSGREELHENSSQHRFWGYNFKYIPIELTSAVYDRFLGEKEAERRDQGAYYTPMFLADTVISQVWNSIPAMAKDKGIFLDPACGSGVFLVRSFQRLCEHWRDTRISETIRWRSLLTILSRLNGWDLNSSSVRVAVFSLYVTLLEQVSPPDIRLLAKSGKLLPELWGKTLRSQDFFAVETNTSFDVIVGNPPWTSRRSPGRSSVKWCTEHSLPMPGKEDAWAFTWKSLRHLRQDGIVAFLLPAMGFLHNHAQNAVEARKRLLNEAHIFRVINFSDLRFQLFEGAVRPAALLIYGRQASGAPPYRFDYWTPKADFNLRIKRLITLCSTDKASLTSKMAIADPLVFKRRLWMSEPDAKLFNYLSTFSKLGDFISTYGNQRRRRRVADDGQWTIGQGFQPFNAQGRPSGNRRYFVSNLVKEIPFLPIRHFHVLAQSAQGLNPWPSSHVRRKGFEEGFAGTRILIPRGINTAKMRLRAAYTNVPLTFQHIIQAITIPSGEERHAKCLTAYLNSKLAAWFAFHGTGSFGSDRPEVKQAELLRLPFPLPGETPNPMQSEKAGAALVQIIDRALSTSDEPFALHSRQEDISADIDRYVYQYFCLSEDEITIVDDALEQVLRAVQPSKGTYPEIWKLAERSDREAYATTLMRSLKDWFEDDSSVGVTLEAHNQDLAILCLTLHDSRRDSMYAECDDRTVGETLSRLFEHIHQPLPGNFQSIPNFRIFVKTRMYLVKPMQKRFWLRSTALADADAIALDLQDSSEHRVQGGRG